MDSFLSADLDETRLDDLIDNLIADEIYGDTSEAEERPGPQWTLEAQVPAPATGPGSA